MYSDIALCVCFSQAYIYIYMLHTIKFTLFSVVVQLLSHVHLFVTPWIVAHGAPLSPATSQSWPIFMSTESVMLSNHIIFCRLNLSQQQGLFQLFASGGQSIGASALAIVLPMKIQGWFPLNWLVVYSLSILPNPYSLIAPTIKIYKCHPPNSCVLRLCS